MSSKSTIILTEDDEHWYNDCSEVLQRKNFKDAITLEFNKKNIRIDLNDSDSLVITITNPNCELYDLLNSLKSKIKKT